MESNKPNKERIAIFSAFYPFRGGIAQFNERLLIALKEKAEIHPFTFKKQYPNWLFPGTSQYDLLREKPIVEAKRIVSAFNIFSYWGAIRKLKRPKPTIFVTNQWMTFFIGFQVVFAWALRHLKGRRVGVVHNLIPHEKRFFDVWMNRLFLKSYDKFIVLSESVRQEVLSLKPDACVKLIEHPWYDHFGSAHNLKDAKLKLGLDTSKKTLLFFGLIRDYKGLDILIESMNDLEGYQLVIAGEVYGKNNQYDELISRNKHAEHIFFFNEYVADNRVSDFFSAADFVVLPYRSASQSGVTAVAFNFRKPVVATRVGALQVTIGETGCGELAEPNSVESLIKAIQKANAADYNVYVQAIEELSSRFSWDYFAEELIAFAQN